MDWKNFVKDNNEANVRRRNQLSKLIYKQKLALDHNYFSPQCEEHSELILPKIKPDFKECKCGGELVDIMIGDELTTRCVSCGRVWDQ